MSEKRKKDEEKEMESKSEKSIKCSERVDSARVSHESSKDSIRYVKSDPLYKLNPDPLINESSITKLKSLEIPDTIYEVEDKRCKERSPGTSTREMESESSVVVDLCKQNSQVMKEKLKKPNRCAVCRKRVGLTGIVCRCGDTFCSAHRYTDTHNCPIDYRELGAEEIRKKNPLIKKDKNFNGWPDEPFEEMDSTLAVQQYIQQQIRKEPSNIDVILTPPENQDEGVWKYEHLRQFCMELNGLAVRLQWECHPETCTQMTATEQWIFLCAAHKTPKECPAIDYTRHTLDGAACLLNSNKYFPSRVSIKDSSVTKLGSVCRRVYRIFSHAYFHHRTIFDEFETETYLCRRFTQFITKYNLMAKDNLIVPIAEADIQVTGESEA